MRGYPISGLDGGEVPGVHPQPGLDFRGYPISGLDVGLPPTHETEQHSEHLLRGGRCASCVHAGGLSC